MAPLSSWTTPGPRLVATLHLQDPAVVAALMPGKEELDKFWLDVIWKSEVLLYTSRQVDKGRMTLLQVESTLGNLITDAMVWAYRDGRDEHNRKFLMAVHHCTLV